MVAWAHAVTDGNDPITALRKLRLFFISALVAGPAGGPPGEAAVLAFWRPSARAPWRQGVSRRGGAGGGGGGEGPPPPRPPRHEAEAGQPGAHEEASPRPVGVGHGAAPSRPHEDDQEHD